MARSARRVAASALARPVWCPPVTCRSRRAVRLRLWLALTGRPGRPRRVARRWRCAGQLARWRLEAEYLQPADVRRLGAPTGMPQSLPEKRERGRPNQRHQAVCSCLVVKFAVEAEIVPGAVPTNCQRCAVQAGSTPSSRCRTWRSCKKSSATMAQLAMTNCRETGGFGRSHSLSFDHRLRPDTLRTAMATAFFCPTSTTSFLPRVTPV